MKLRMVATCLFGLERLLGEEIDKIGGVRVETIDGRVTFDGDENTLVRANICLRFAERVFIWLGSFPAYSFDELFEGTKALPWEKYIGRDDIFPVKGHAIHSRLYSLPDCQSIVKKAVVDRLSGKYGIRIFPETNIKYQIEFFIFKDMATLMIDTSGAPLHKRGYRPASGEAPLRETLGAAIASIARTREDVLFWDPFCGSGTIVIEAAMIATERAPGLGRGFAAEDFPIISSDIWQEERERAQSLIKHDSLFEAYGSDIDTDVLSKARENAKRAGVDGHIRFFEADARKISKEEGRRGTVACNPPYGERLMTVSEAEALYRDMGKAFERLSPWQIYVLTSAENFEQLYGSRADKIRKLYNGMIPCRLYQYFKPKDIKKKDTENVQRNFKAHNIHR